jgi:hypothetical protein
VLCNEVLSKARAGHAKLRLLPILHVTVQTLDVALFNMLATTSAIPSLYVPLLLQLHLRSTYYQQVHL